MFETQCKMTDFLSIALKQPIFLHILDATILFHALSFKIKTNDNQNNKIEKRKYQQTTIFGILLLIIWNLVSMQPQGRIGIEANMQM